jgi:hypothetical protein
MELVIDEKRLGRFSLGEQREMMIKLIHDKLDYLFVYTNIVYTMT